MSQEQKKPSTFRAPVIAVTCPLCGPTTAEFLEITFETANWKTYLVLTCGCKWHEKDDEWETEK